MGSGDVIMQDVQPNAGLDSTINTPVHNCVVTDDDAHPAVLNSGCSTLT